MRTRQPAVALLGGAELDDVRELLERLGIEAVEARHAAVGESVPLLLSSPASALAKAEGRAEAPPCELHVVLCERPEEIDTPADLALLRPIETAVLRLLARRREAEGLERRLAIRVALGAAVSLRVGDDRREVTMARISIGGCGLESPAPLRPGTRVEIALPEALTEPRRLELVGRVLSLDEIAGEDGPRYDVSVGFETLEIADRVTLRALMSRHAVDYRPRSEGARPRARGLRDRELPTGDGERRKLPRRAFQRRLIGAREGRARVLMALDLSPEGTRVEADEALVVGDAWKLALCPGTDATPLALDCRVARDDGPNGCFLRFEPYSAEMRAALDTLLAALAPLETD